MILAHREVSFSSHGWCVPECVVVHGDGDPVLEPEDEVRFFFELGPIGDGGDQPMQDVPDVIFDLKHKDRHDSAGMGRRVIRHVVGLVGWDTTPSRDRPYGIT